MSALGLIGTDVLRWFIDCKWKIHKINLYEWLRAEIDLERYPEKAIIG